ncbi:MAG TPA: hydantoinase B/oxoprolinase family protein, partial [Anaerolineae bacterium]|nr:hydantoinase B/oxoprolinase family protein [Anaerolineae bacterium]
MRYKADPITMQVIRYAMEQVADEMGYTLVRTARSTVIKEIKDISCAVFDRAGNTVAQAHHAPMLLTGFELGMRALRQYYRDDELEDGDIIIFNDPYGGGQHVMDLVTFAPVKRGSKLVGFVGSIAHHSDMGGAAPGGTAGGLTEIYLEGLRLPFVKLYKRGQEDRELFGIIANNIRVPDKTLGDIRAQASANFVGVRRVREIVEKYSPAVTQKCLELLLNVSEARIRAGLAALPDGDYTGEDWVDDDGVTDDPIHLQVNIHKHGDSAHIDFEGTSKQVRGNVNAPLATVHAAVYYALIAIADPHAPPNSGCYRPFTIEAEPGTIVNPKMPAAVGARTNTVQKITEAVFRALAPAVPERVMAGSHGNITNCGFSGYHPTTGKRFVYIDIQGGGAGARPSKDGRDGQDSHLARFKNTPVEAVELEYPVRVERYEFIPDSGGAGKYRGALAVRRDIRILIDNVSWARYGDRQRFAPFGLFGGKDGAKGQFVLNPDTPQERIAKSKGLDTLNAGDVVSLRLPGAGGYGDPRERDAEAVRRDVRDGKITPESAQSDYGVEIGEGANTQVRPYVHMDNSILSELGWDAEGGALSYKGVRYLLIRPETLYGIVEAAEEKLDAQRAGELLYRGGFVGGQLSGKRYREALNLAPHGAVEFMCKMGGEIGWGHFELVEFDHAAARLVVHIHNSAFTEMPVRESKRVEEGVCHLIRGVLGGLLAGLTGKDVIAREVHCRAQGHDYCRV